ncbi:rhodanese-like domain-containing protein [Micromonospora echinaurantiaca]|uniref:Rhodanese-related sulfurtransferase n=1 Tax=Micromonospora echinaurantiaca TaxID=47857 RepID=A0A1C5HG71_9ACTN|nr:MULTISPECIES: rhodanese-like domain-containing protein [Micromonospora]PWU54298.1 rhodanese-like domain-containing protein [Micromonospora sp. S4605]SCG45069.1 Rhodanese-related sulfurtransferase [Micromonospora echinaurantiaca]
MREVNLADFAAAHAAGAVVVDVREPFEYVEGHVPGARSVPLAQLPAAVGDLPRSRPVYVICASGNRSLTAAQFLARAGIDARSVGGGTGGWIRSGRPVATGADA